MSFIKQALAGKVMYDEIDDFVESWHCKPGDETLAEFLGFSKKEYEAWAVNPDIVPQIITGRKFNRPFENVLQSAYEERIAARSASVDRLAEMKRWLAKRSQQT